MIGEKMKKMLIIIILAFVNGCTNFFAKPQIDSIQEKLAKLEISANGKIGFAAINTKNNVQITQYGLNLGS